MSSQTGEWAHSFTFCAKDSAHRRRRQSDGEDNVYQGSSVRRPRACLARVLRRPEVGEAASTRETFRKNELHTPRVHAHVHEKAGKNALLLTGQVVSELLGWICFSLYPPDSMSINCHTLTDLRSHVNVASRGRCQQPACPCPDMDDSQRGRDGFWGRLGSNQDG